MADMKWERDKETYEEWIVRLNAHLKDESAKYWPAHQLSFSLLAGACEVGQDLILTGLFGGFGGCFFAAHRSAEEAIQYLQETKFSGGGQLYRLKVESLRTWVGPDGQVIKED